MTGSPKIQALSGGLELGDVQDMIFRHRLETAQNSPECSDHSLDTDKLSDPSIRFWHFRLDNNLVGMGALKLDTNHQAEIKSMRSVRRYRGKGVGEFILKFLIEQALSLGIKVVELETGTTDYFRPARRLYKRFGFEDCPPIKGYQASPYNCFMRLKLGSTRSITKL